MLLGQPSQNFTEKEIVEVLRGFKKMNQRMPLGIDFIGTGIRPCYETIRMHFGSWEAALSVAFPANSAPPHVLIDGRLFIYEAKAPFEESGKSIRGAVEYDNAAEMMRCHECGEFRRNLAHHVGAHGLTAREYKAKHGLRAKTALVADQVRLRISDAARKSERMADPVLARAHMNQIRTAGRASACTPEAVEKRAQSTRSSTPARQNLTGTCRAQVLEKIRLKAVDLGRTPSLSDLQSLGVSGTYLRYHFGSASNAQRLAGLTPNKSSAGMQKYSTEFLVEQLRMFLGANGRLPRYTDADRGLLVASASSYNARCGNQARWLLACPHEGLDTTPS